MRHCRPNVSWETNIFASSTLSNQIHRRAFLNSAGVSLGSAALSALMAREGRAALLTQDQAAALTSRITCGALGSEQGDSFRGKRWSLFRSASGR